MWRVASCHCKGHIFPEDIRSNLDHDDNWPKKIEWNSKTNSLRESTSFQIDKRYKQVGFDSCHEVFHYIFTLPKMEPTLERLVFQISSFRGKRRWFQGEKLLYTTLWTHNKLSCWLLELLKMDTCNYDMISYHCNFWYATIWLDYICINFMIDVSIFAYKWPTNRSCLFNKNCLPKTPGCRWRGP